MKTNQIKYIHIDDKEVAEMKIKGKIAYQRLNYILGRWNLGQLPFKGSRKDEQS